MDDICIFACFRMYGNGIDIASLWNRLCVSALKIANKMSLTAQHILNLDLFNLKKLKLNGKYINQCSK